MAKKQYDFLTALCGKVVVRTVGNVQVVSQKVAKGTMKQTKLTRTYGHVFGIASSLAAEMMNSFLQIHRGAADRGAGNRLRSVMIRLLNICRDADKATFTFLSNSFFTLAGLEFNINSKLYGRLQKLPTVKIDSGKLLVTVPAVDLHSTIYFPKNSSRCELVIGLSLYRLDDSLKSATMECKSLFFLKDSGYFDECQVEFNVPQGCLCVTSIALHHFVLAGETWVPFDPKMSSGGAILDATLVQGEYVKNDNIRWSAMTGFADSRKKFIRKFK